MKVYGEQLVFDSSSEHVTPATLKVCLEYLYTVAMTNGHRMSAHLIGAAAEACVEQKADHTQSFSKERNHD